MHARTLSWTSIGGRLRTAAGAWAITAAAIVAPSPAAADPSHFRSVPGQALDARTLFEPMPQTAFRLGTALKLVPRQHAQARAQFATGFQVRVFRVDGPGMRPAVLAEFDPCLVYLGTVFQFSGNSNLDEVNLGGLDDLGWLTLQEGRMPQNGRFLIVAEPLVERHDLFRVEKGSAMDRYFERGIYFEVAPGGNSIDMNTVNTALKEARQHWSRVLNEAKRNEPDLDCVHLAKAASTDQAPQLAEVETCLRGGTESPSLI